MFERVAVIVPSVALKPPVPLCSAGLDEVPVKVKVSDKCVGESVIVAGLGVPRAAPKPVGVTVMEVPVYPELKLAVTVTARPTPEKKVKGPVA